MDYPAAPTERRDIVRAIGYEWPGPLCVCDTTRCGVAVMIDAALALSPDDLLEMEEKAAKKFVDALPLAIRENILLRVTVHCKWANNNPVLYCEAFLMRPGNPRFDNLPQWIRAMQGPSTEGNAIHAYVFDASATMEDLYKWIITGLIKDRERARMALYSYKKTHTKKTK